MSTKEKLEAKFRLLPNDFTYKELVRLLEGLGFEEDNKGKTSGSRVRFYNASASCFLDFHKPHPAKVMHRSTLKDILDKLINSGLIK